MGNGYVLSGYPQNVLLMEEGYLVGVCFSGVALQLLPGNVAGMPPIENVPVCGWHHPAAQEPGYPQTVALHSVQRIHVVPQR